VIIGSYPTILVTCRILHVPLVWTIQSTWLESFFSTGAGMTDNIRIKPVEWVAFYIIKMQVTRKFDNIAAGKSPGGARSLHPGVAYYFSFFIRWHSPTSG
jgi:hypothetical protein